MSPTTNVDSDLYKDNIQNANSSNSLNLLSNEFGNEYGFSYEVKIQSCADVMSKATYA